MSKPIAMRMNAEQFESIKVILEANDIKTTHYNKSYDFALCEGKILIMWNGTTNPSQFKEIHEEFNAKVFLNSLGIEYEEPQPTEQVERYNIFDKAQQLIKDAKQQGVEIEIKEGVIILKQMIC